MKRLVILTLSFILSREAYTQATLENLLTQKKVLPVNWVNIITSQAEWNVTNSVPIGNNSRKIYPSILHGNPALITITYQFSLTKVSKSPFFVDTTKTLSVVYFPKEGTFYTSYTIMLDGKPFTLKFPFQVYYLDSTYMALEHLDEIHFDYDSGKILSDEELEKRMAENREKSKNQPGSYDVSDSKKKRSKKSEEGVRLVELLSIKN
jgi:hypothetical protein